MTKTPKKIDKTHLINLGIKDALLNKLSEKQIQDLLEYSVEHSTESELPRHILQLASMEATNKKGASELAKNDIATIGQLKNLTAEQIEIILTDLSFHHDNKLAIKAVKRYIVLNQQEKMYFESGGVKGEYYIDPHTLVEEEEIA